MRDLASLCVRLVSRIVPAAARREFREEWEAELASEWRVAGARSLRTRARVTSRALGSLSDAVCLFRQQWGVAMILQDLRQAWRVLVRRPVYVFLVVLTLGVGIGATTAMFSAVDAVLLRPLPYPDPSRLIAVWENDRVNAKPRYPVAPANWHDWRTRSRTFEGLAAWIDSGGSLTIDGDPVRLSVPVVTTDLFSVLGVSPMLGRSFAPGDSVPPNHRVLVLSFDTWQQRFAGDPRVVDTTVQYGGVPYRVIGVMPREFRFPSRDAAAWRPAAVTPQLLETRAQHYLSVVGRLKPGVTIEQAHADLETIAIDAQKAYPDTNDQRGTTIAGLQEAVEGGVRRPMLLVAAAVVLTLLIGVSNVANLMLVEGTSRRREMAVRTALGADRLRIIRQLCIEGILLATVGGAVGLGLAMLGVTTLATLAGEYVPRIDQVSIDGRVLAFACVVSILTGIMFALAPAVVVSKTDVQNDLRQGARGTIGQGRRVRAVLVGAEVTAAVVLTIGAALAMRSFWNVLAVEPGFATQVMTASTDLPARYDQDAAITQFYDEVLGRLKALPQVAEAAIVNNLPISGNAWTSWLTIENAPAAAGEPPEVGLRSASPGYFAALQIPVLQGRPLLSTDTATAMRVAVVNRALSERFFPTGDAVGRRIRLGPNPKAPWWTIVGIVGDVRHHGPEAEILPEAFLPAAQMVNGDMTLVVRGHGEPADLASAIRSVVRAVDSSVTVWRLRTLDSMLQEVVAPRRLAMLLVEGFAAVALILALVGIYGVLSYTVSQRRAEFGVRMALGASPGAILKGTLRDGLELTLPGLALGVAIALVATYLVRSVLFNVSPADPIAYTAVLLCILAVSAVASYVPARRASRVDPISAIRVD